MGQITLPCESGQVSDGYHTFDELYAHRCALFVALMLHSNTKGPVWRSLLHDDGTMFDGWFIAGMSLPTGPITYHLPIEMWDTLNDPGVATLNQAFPWDGHTPADVVQRLNDWIML